MASLAVATTTYFFVYPQVILPTKSSTTTTSTKIISNACNPTYLNSFRCFGNTRQQLYQGSDCNEIWINQQYCQNGCSNGICLPPTQTTASTTTYSTTTTTSTIPSCLHVIVTSNTNNPFTYGNYYVSVTEAIANSWVRIVIKDITNSVRDSFVISQGSSKDSVSTDMTIRLNKADILGDGTIVGIDLTVSKIGAYCPSNVNTTTSTTTSITTPTTTTTSPSKTLPTIADSTIFVFSGGTSEMIYEKTDSLTRLNNLNADVAYRIAYTYGVNETTITNQLANIDPYISTLHQNGILSVGVISGSIVSPDQVSASFAEDVATRNVTGGKVLYHQDPSSPTYYYHGDIHNANWRNYLERVSIIMIDKGIDGIEFDEATSYWWYLNEGEFYSTASIQEFNNYLKLKYSAEQLSSKFGIQNIDNFNYRDYLQQHSYANLNNEWQRISQSLLGHDFYVFELKSTSDHIKEIANYIKSYAQTKYQKNLIVITNQFEFANIDVPYSSSLDFFSFGIGMQYFSPSGNKFGPPYYSIVPMIKKGLAIDKTKQSVPFNDATPNILNPDIIKIMISEAYASGGYYNMPSYLWTAGNYPGNPKWPVENLYSYANFIQQNSYLYHNQQNYAKVAVLYSYEEDMWAGTIRNYNGWLYGTMQVLTDAHIPFDVIFSGDGNVMPDDLTLQKLQPYDAVILVQEASLSDNKINVIHQYVSAGGKVLLGGYNGISDSMGNPRSGDPFADIEANPNVILDRNLDWSNLLNYLTTRNVTTRSEMTSKIATLSNLILQTNAPDTVGVSIFSNQNGIYSIHLFNYNYDNSAIVPSQNIYLKVQLPTNVNNYKVKVISPDGNVNLLNARLTGNTFETTIDSLNFYDVIVLSPS